MKRIKYKYVNSKLMSKDSFLCGNQYLFIVLEKHSEVFHYEIKNYEENKVICQGTAKTLTLIKKYAKMKLIELGASFMDEVRKKEVIG